MCPLLCLLALSLSLSLKAKHLVLKNPLRISSFLSILQWKWTFTLFQGGNFRLSARRTRSLPTWPILPWPMLSLLFSRLSSASLPFFSSASSHRLLIMIHATFLGSGTFGVAVLQLYFVLIFLVRLRMNQSAIDDG